MSLPSSSPIVSGQARALQAQDLCRQAEDAREGGRWEEAASAAAAATALAPDTIAGWVELSLARLALHQDAASLEAAQDAVRRAGAGSGPDAILYAAARRALALALLRHRRIDEAEQAMTDALRALPGYPEGLATLALLRTVQGRLQEADALFQHAVALKGTMAEAIGNRAALLARLGRDAEALAEAGRAVALKPFLAGTQILRGRLLLRAGRPAEAADALAAALAADPGSAPEIHANRVEALRLAGRPAEAAEAALDALERHPGNPALLANLGAALQAAGDADAALAAYEQALEVAPDLPPGLPEIDNNVARLHLDAGRRGPALLHLRRAFAARPGDPDIARNLAALLLDIGIGPDNDPEEAERVARAATEADPLSAEGLVLLGRALGRRNRGEEAEAAFQAALRLAPARVETWWHAGTTLLLAGRTASAVTALRQLCRLAPESARHWALLGQALRRVRFAAADDGLRADLLAALERPGAENSHLTGAVIGVVRLAPAVAGLCAATGQESGNDGALRGLVEGGLLGKLATDRLLNALLENCIVADPDLERALTALRRLLLTDGLPADAAAALPFLCALAAQGFLSEYAFAWSAAEEEAAARLAGRLEAETATGKADPAAIALLAACRPLHRWAGMAALDLSHPWPEPFARLLARQVADPVDEERLKAEIPALTPIEDAVSQAVRAQYEENPYPRWADAGLIDAAIPVPAALHTLFPHATVAPGPWWEAPEVLVAGCGTGREAVWAANHFRGARVLAVDLSLTSLAYAVRQSRRLGIAVEYAQADILRLGTLGRRFDMIHSVGVLHHMDDPLAGLGVLAGLLRPHGAMKIGLYSERARTAIVAARRFAADRGYAGDTAGIRRFRQDVFALSDGHPVKTLAGSLDFYSTSACRDLVFNVQEHRHTLPQIAGWLEALNLEFLGFQLEDPSVAGAYRARFPEDPAMVDLARWDRFEAEFPHLFGELYQFWVRPRA